MFIPFGYLLTILGGSLLQVLVPVIFIGYFFWKQQPFSASVLGYWLAINFFNVSVYAGDALTRKLPLLTGDVDTHDWNQILFTLGLLRQTDLIADIILGLGVFVLFVSFAATIYFSVQSRGKTGF